jgi:hypothetical protein
MLATLYCRARKAIFHLRLDPMKNHCEYESSASAATNENVDDSLNTPQQNSETRWDLIPGDITDGYQNWPG